MPPRTFAAAIVLALVASACGSATQDAASRPAADRARGEFAFGKPALPPDATRTIEVRLLDSMRFDPPTITVSAGDVVTFHIVNVGKIPHDFVLGDEALQASHAAEASDGHSHSYAANAVSLQAGQEGSLSWRFAEPGTVLYGCHVPGHYGAGMVGTITIRE